jgi:anti-sigma factor RsiW
MTDPFRYDAASYVLGALPPDQRHAFEEHRAGCASCDAAVRDFAGLPGLLARLPEQDLDAALGQAMPAPSLLPSLTAQVRRQRRGARWRAAIAGLVAASLVAVGTAVVVQAVTDRQSTTQQAAELAFRPVADTSLKATASLQAKPWGTEVTVRCWHYAELGTGATAPTFWLVARDKDGKQRDLGDWQVPSQPEIRMQMSTGLHRDQLAGLDIVESGRVILTLQL